MIAGSATPTPGHGGRISGDAAAEYDALLAESEEMLLLALRALTEDSVHEARERLAACRHVGPDPEVTAKPSAGGGVHTVVSALLRAKMLRLQARTAADADSVARLEYDAAIVRVRMLNGFDGAIRAMEEASGAGEGRGGRVGTAAASACGNRPETAASGVSGAEPLPDDGGDGHGASRGGGGGGGGAGRGGGSRRSRPTTAAMAGLGAGAEVAALLDRALDEAEEVVTGVIAVAHVRSSAITLHGEIAGIPPGGDATADTPASGALQ